MRHYEIEKKYKLREVPKIRKILRRLGAKKQDGFQEQNSFWDFNRKLEKSKKTLRLRRYGSACTLTFKGPRRKQKQEIDKRLEFETTVQFKEMRAILKAIGFTIRLQYTKTREMYRLKDVIVTIDHLKRYGWFLEIEGPSKSILAVEKQLQLKSSDYEPRSYLSMILSLNTSR